MSVSPRECADTGVDQWFEREAVKWLRQRGYIPLTADEAETVRRGIRRSAWKDIHKALALLSPDSDTA